MINKGFRRFKRTTATADQVYSGEGELVPHPPPNVTSSNEILESDRRPPILNESECGEILSGVAVPHPPRGRRDFCKKFLEEHKDNHSPYRDTINTWSRKLPHHLSLCDGVQQQESSKLKPAGYKILPPISKKIDPRKIINGVRQPRLKDCVPQPPPSGTSEIIPAPQKFLPPISNRKGAVNIVSHQSTALPIKKQNGVPVPHPPSERSLLCRNLIKEQKDNVSPQRDTFSTWYRRPVQLPDLLDVDVCDPELHPTHETSEVADVEVLQAPQRSSEWFAFCKNFKEEEQKDRPSARQDTFSSWCRQLPKVRRKDGVTDPSDFRFSRLSQLPEHEKEKDHEEEIGKLKWVLMEEVRREQERRKKSPKSQHCKDADSPPEQEESETFSRRLAKGCWDHRCLQRLISDLEAIQREESRGLSVSSRKPSALLVSPPKPRDLLVSSRKPRELLEISPIYRDLPESSRKSSESSLRSERSSASTDSLNTTDNDKLLRKLHHLQTHLHFTLKSFIDESQKALEIDRLNVHVDLKAELEYVRIEKSLEFYGNYKDLCLNLKFPEWQEKFHLDPEDPFHFENPQDLIDWIKCIGLSDLVEN
ncbi:uncharacterized protein LOC130414534 [Triplophysa dalaica]|uniref:uncharacterized protein LOC130414534 n=1 Tax=Triplophysa dalaica TaxID=1582913 RepID=UPI0024E019A5|nr:uncharacterized protein LOC130414534 [Triplophysa dalaica]